MGRDTPWLVVSVAVTLLAGALSGLRINLAQLLVVELDVSAGAVGPVLTAVAAVTLVVNPLGTFLAGYLWGRHADVETEYGHYVLILFVAALAGFTVTYVVTLLPLLGQDHGVGNAFGRVVSGGLFALSLIGVALTGFAGSAVAHFRRSRAIST